MLAPVCFYLYKRVVIMPQYVYYILLHERVCEKKTDVSLFKFKLFPT